jgi:uncharacterized membrane protein (DUF4010 family)
MEGSIHSFAPFPTFARLMLALAIGLFIGAERERRRKEAGLRTFGFASLLGAIGGLLGEPYATLALVFLGVLVILLNIETMRSGEGAELTTSAALIVTGFVGLLAGQGHTFTPTTVGIVTAGLLAWKDRLVGFSVGLTEAEFRSAILLGILAFVVYPILPTGDVDPWQLVDPRSAWITVILIAGMGFGNYVLLKLYGSRGIALAGFLGGLINSTVTASELARRIATAPARLLPALFSASALAIAAMVARNAVILGVLAPVALVPVALSLVLMFGVSLAFGVGHTATDPMTPDEEPLLSSPLSLAAALKFGVLFLAIQVSGTVAQRFLGNSGLYVVSAIGGFVSSASAVAAAANLAAAGTVSATTAGAAALLASIVSGWVNLPFLARIGQQPALTRRLVLMLTVLSVAAAAGLFAARTMGVGAYVQSGLAVTLQ